MSGQSPSVRRWPGRALPPATVAALRVSDFLTVAKLRRSTASEHRDMQDAIKAIPEVPPGFAPVAELARAVSATPNAGELVELTTRLTRWCVAERGRADGDAPLFDWSAAP